MIKQKTINKNKTKFTCPYCGTKRVNPFPISDESGDVYCPDCNWTLKAGKKGY